MNLRNGEKLHPSDERIERFAQQSEHARNPATAGIGYHVQRREVPFMSEFQLRQLPVACRRLLNKFYRAHRTHMRMPAGARGWVAGQPDIVAGLCLNPVDGGHWLTGLLVAPSQRNQGLAKRLVAQALADSGGPIWLFCEPKLVAFYQQLGFSDSTTLPEALASRLHRYNRNKTLVALWHDNERLHGL